MKRQMAFAFVCVFLMFALTNRVYAADESFADQFLGSPLLILVAIVVIVAVAFVYHKIRK
jgi:cadmium resistance protein CadD (predicted permease)